jgi:hypothetical protein
MLLAAKQQKPGVTAMHGRAGGACLFFVSLIPMCGCHDARPQPAELDRKISLAAGRQYDPQIAGSIRGRVVWQGALPSIAPIRGNVTTSLYQHDHIVRENPNRPVVDAGSLGVGNAVVFLRKVDPDRCKAWDHERVRIEQCDLEIRIHQGAGGRIGFMRVGDAIEVVSRDKHYHALRGRGAAVFTLPLVDPDKPTFRTLNRTGLVELSSGAGYPWMHAYLFVVDHPYLARTNASGEFALTEVPPGSYEVVCWVPNWHTARQERNLETGHVERVFFAPPAELTRPVDLAANETASVPFTISVDTFAK